jgi:hypothetical protein
MGTIRLARDLRVEADVQATPAEVWRVVSDVIRIGEWSHECRRLEWIGGATSATPGARFRGVNKASWLRWSRVNEVIVVEPGHRIAWLTLPTWLIHDSTRWEITLEPLAHGTRVVQTYEVVQCPRWWEWLVARVVPPHRDRREALTADLHRIGDVAAAQVPARSPGSGVG